MRRLIAVLAVLCLALVAGPATAQELDAPEVPDVEVPDVEVPDVPDLPDLPDGADGVLPGDEEGDDAEDEEDRETSAAPTPFGHTCSEQDDVLFCPTRTLADRVPSFDGTPLDVDVTLPVGTQAGQPLPTIVIMHGYGGNKTDFESGDPDGKRDEDDRDFHFNNNFYAKRGYAVVNYTARGFGRSCGRTENSNATPDCVSERGYIHLADQRWEVRDTQYLLGLLADDDVTVPDKIGVTGISYGGGQSIMLAFLKDRIRDLDGDFEAWKSPEGKDLKIAAAFPRWPWSDLVSSLLPNGRFLDDDPSTGDDSRDPLGVPIESYINGLYLLGQQGDATYCGVPPRPTPDPVPPGQTTPGGADLFPPCQDFTADLTEWKNRIEAGEPYEGEPLAEAIAAEIVEFHGGFSIGGTPSPLLLQSGWTDDLFPPSESLRVYNELDGAEGDDTDGDGPDGASDAPVSLQFGDIGHPRASNKEETDQDFNDQGAAFFDEYLKGASGGDAPDPGSVSAYTQTCPADEEPDGPFEADSWPAIQEEVVPFGDADEQVVTSPSGDVFGPLVDPIANMQDPCRQLPDQSRPGVAVYRGEEAGEGYTMVGRPTVSATIATTPGAPVQGQIDSRLWDVGPGGVKTLVSRGAYRLTEGQSGNVTFQLNGNGWCFAPGHSPKLELLGRDTPYLRQSNGGFSVDVSAVAVELPVLDEPCDTAPPGGGGGGPGGGGSDGSDENGSTGGNGGGSGGGGSSGGGGGGSGGSDDSGAPESGAPPGPPPTVACLVPRLGGSGADRLFGSAGGDAIQGLAGADRLFGLAGDDCLFGGAGDDRLSGGPGNDRLSGGAGDDVLRGGTGANAYSGGAGDDRVFARDGHTQTVSCGVGTDTAWVDTGDGVRDCERVVRPRRRR